MRVAITGAATGIGAATAVQLKAGGAEVIAFDIADPGNKADQWINTDLSHLAMIRKAIDQVTGPFEAVINCAGLPPRNDNSRDILALNYFGLVAFTERVLPELAQGASIVNVASRAGELWRDNFSQVTALMSLGGPEALAAFVDRENIDPLRAYMLSKEAVIAWSLLNCERLIGMGFRVNCVSPSAVATDILGDFMAALGERAERSIARAGRAATTDEIASVICFLAGPASGWVKGQNIAIDGGVSAMTLADQLRLEHGL